MEISKLTDFSCLNDFYCGVDTFDNFIHNNGLKRSIENHFCVPYKVCSGKKVVAFFALSCGSLVLDEYSKDDFFSGYSDPGYAKIPEEYKDVLKNKIYYPALDIAYLAVREEYRHKHIGEDLMTKIEERAKNDFNNNFAGCQFLVLDAYHTHKYSTLDFYRKCGFTQCDLPKVGSDTVRMYKSIF